MLNYAFDCACVIKKRYDTYHLVSSYTRLAIAHVRQCSRHVYTAMVDLRQCFRHVYTATVDLRQRFRHTQ